MQHVMMNILNIENVLEKMTIKILKENSLKKEFISTNDYKQLGFIKEGSYYLLTEQRKKT